MPLYQIQAPNGKTYRIEGPAGASQDDVISAVLQQFPDAGNAPLPPESGIGASFKRGVESLLSTSRTGVEAAVGDAQKAAEAGIARQQETAQRYEAPASLERVKEAYEKRGILGGAAEAISQIPGAIAEQLPQFATMGAGAAAGAAAGAPLGPVGATVGGAIGAALPVLVQAFGGNLQRQVQEGKPVDVGAAAATAPVQAAADVISARVTFGSRIVGKLLGKSDDALMKMGAEQAEALAKEKLLTVAAKGTAKGAAAEIPTELAQTMLERLQAGLPLTSPDALAEYGDVAYGTALLGPIGALGRLAERAGARQEVARREAEQAETPQTPPLALPGAQPFTPVVFPDGSVATTPEQVAQYEASQVQAAKDAEEAAFRAKYAPQPADFKNLEFTPEEIAAEQARRKAEAVPPITPAKEAAGAFAEKLPLFPDEAVYATKPEPAPEPITVTRKDLLDLGISKNAPIIKRIAGLELTDPENLNTVVRELARFAANPSIKPEVVTKVREVANNLRNAAPAAQGALSFAPPAPEVAGAQMSDALRQAEERRAYEDRQREEEFRKQEESSRIANIAAAQQQLQLAEQEAQREAGLEPVTGPAAAPAGAGVSVPSERGAGLAPAGVGPSVGAGVDVAGATPAVAVEGAGPQPGALKQAPQPTQEPIAALAAAPAIPTTPGVSSTPEATAVTEAAPTTITKPRDRSRAPTPTADEAFVKAITRAYQQEEDVAEPTSQNAVYKLLSMVKQPNAEARAAAVYFGKRLGAYQLRLVDALKNIAFDIAYDTPVFHAERADKSPEKEALVTKLLGPARQESNVERQFMSGMNGSAARKAAKWVADNLDEGAVSTLTKFIEEYRDDYKRVQLLVAQGELVRNAVGIGEGVRDATVQAYLDAERMLREGPLALRTSLGVPLHPAVITLLGEGDFTAAMRMLAAGTDPRIAKLATRLLNAAVNPKVEIVGDLTDEAGKPVDGLYDPRTNTIKLDSVKGMNAHVLLHETGHSALSHVLDDPNHPVTRQMQTLLNNARELLDTAYGAQDVQEFAAEALGNLSFREKLNAINPGGGKITMWQQFSNIVRNFFRRLLGLTGKPIESSLDVVDQLIDEIISPAPGTRDAGVLYAANATDTKGAFRKFSDKAADWTESLPGMTRERADKLHEFTTNAVSEAVRMAYLASLPLKLLSDAASRVLPDAAKISRLVDERSGVIHTRNEQIEALVNRANRWAKAAGEAMVKTFNDVVYFSTINEVDPTRDISYYQPKKITPETLDEFEKKKALLAQVKADFAKLNPEGQKLYVSMRDAYKKMYEEIIDSLSTQTSEVLGDDEAAKTIKNQVFRRLLEKGTIDPYFPLTRQGDKWLAYGTGEDRAVEAFESERARDRRIAELEAQGVKNIEKYSKLAQMNYRRAPASSFVADVVRQLKTDKVSEEKIEKVVKLFLDRLPETAFAKGFQAREGTPGFERDAIGAMQRKLFATSRQIANMQYAPKLNKAIAELEEYSKTLEASGQDTRIVNAYIDEYRKRVDFINNPTAPKWSQIATSLGFNMLLGFNISSAFVNLAQVPMVLMPYLGGTYGYGQANRAINNAYKTFFATGRQRKVGIFGSQETETTKAMYSLNNIDFSDPKLPPELKKYEPLVRAAREQGQIDGSQIYDTLEVQGDVSPLAKVNAIGGWMFHHADRINRQVSMLAAYDLELARLNSSKDGANLTTAEKEEKAANYAIHAAEMTQGGTSMASAPRLAQDRAGIGRVLMMFKRYGISMLYLQFKMLREATKSEDKNVRDAARSQFAGLVGMSALFAGMQGIPFFGAAALLYNMFKDDDDDDLETATRKTLGEFMTYGPLSYLTNIDFSGRVSMTDLLLRDMRTGDAPSAADSFMSAFGGPVWGVYTKVERGASLMGQGQMWRGLEQMMPSAIGNVLKGTRYLTEGTNTLRGDPITGDVNSWNVGAQLLGFAPADYQRQLEINNVKKGIDKAVNTEKTSLLRRYYTAQRIGDYEEVADVREKLEELFAKHPGLGSLSQTIERSMKAHERTTKRMVNGIVVSKKLEDELNALGEELGD